MDALLQRLALSDHTILLTGRTGTGKSHLAREIHEKSRRVGKRYVAINLATLSENLIESELFGHERGAFSGADQKRIGKLESANEGTVFLDEIGELSPRLQTKLLEALNSKVVSPVGSNREIRLNIRILTATNKNLEEMVRNCSFREDLYFRINTFHVELPSLRDQRTRLPGLLQELATQAAKEQSCHFSGYTDEYLKAALCYEWPGNIRELKNALEFGVAVTTNGLLDFQCLPPYLRRHLASPNPSGGQIQSRTLSDFPTNYQESKARFEKLYLEEMLRRFEGKINLTARSTCLSKVTLIEKIRRYGIDVNRIKYARFGEMEALHAKV